MFYVCFEDINKFCLPEKPEDFEINPEKAQ